MVVVATCRKMALLQLLAASLFALLVPSASGDFVESCPSMCRCKWSGGRQTVDCSSGGFTAIPTTVHQETKVLIMDGNYIKELGKDAFNSGLANLHKISLKNCHIQRIHEEAFSKLKIVMEIHLDGNNLTKLAPKTFDGNERLKTLLLSGNQLELLQPYQFPPLPELKKIDLSNSGLKEVSPKAFMNLGPSVEEVDLSGNFLTYLREETFLPLTSLKLLSLQRNPWVCDCKLQSFRDYVVHRNLFNPPAACSEPARLADKVWTEVKSLDFACKPEIEVKMSRVHTQAGANVTLSCYITGNPVPSARWVIRGRIIQNNSAPLHSAGMLQQYLLHELALAEGGVERNFSLTITNVNANDEGDYNCVAMNQGGMAERNVTLTFSPLSSWPGDGSGEIELTVLIGAAAGGVLFLVVLIIAFCCLCRRRGKDKTGHAHNGNLLSYSDSAGEKLLPQNGTLPRTNPVPKPPRAGEYGILPTSDQELTEYGPASYVPGDRYDEYGEGRTSASNSDQTGTLSRNSYHGSDPDQYPDLLDIPNRYKQASPTSCNTTTTTLGPLPPLSFHHHHHQPLHPAHLVSPPPHHLLLHPSPFQRTGTLPPNYSLGTLPHPGHHPRSVSCDHSAGGAPHPRPGYVTLPRRPRASWAGVRDTPSPSASSCSMAVAPRDPVYDGVGPRTSADGSSKLSLNRSVDMATPRGQTGNGRVAFNGPALVPYCPPIDEAPECPPTPKTSSTPNILALAEPKGKLPPPLSKRSPLSSSQQTLVEENLAAYCEPWGTALPPSAAPRTRDSIASTDSEILPDRSVAPQVQPVMCSTPKSSHSSGATPPAVSPPIAGQQLLDTIPESEVVRPTTNGQARRLPPPTLPKPKSRPLPPPKPKKPESGEDSFQDETQDGSEV